MACGCRGAEHCLEDSEPLPLCVGAVPAVIPREDRGRPDAAPEEGGVRDGDPDHKPLRRAGDGTHAVVGVEHVRRRAEPGRVLQVRALPIGSHDGDITGFEGRWGLRWV